MLPAHFSSNFIIGLSSKHSYKEMTYAHSHMRAQLLYASEGSIQVFTQDQVWIMPAMCALWIPPRTVHSVLALSQVKLNTALVEEDTAKTMGDQCFLIRVSPLLHESLIRFNQLDERDNAKADFKAKIYQALQVIILDEIQNAHSLSIQIPWPKDSRLLKVCEKLLAHPHQSKDLNTWADEIGTSSRTLMRMFQKETGLTYRAWIQQMHIALALSKISEGQNIKQVSEYLGYSSNSAFSAMFKRHLGQTPQQFKQAKS